MVTSQLVKDDFSDPDAKLGFEVALRLVHYGEAVTLLTWTTEMRNAGHGGSMQAVLDWQTTVILAGEAKTLIRRIKESSTRRIIAKALELTERKLNQGATSQECRETLMTELGKTRAAGNGISSITAVLNDLAEEMVQPKQPGMLTPWGNVNDYWGELEPGMLVVLGAAPKIGKTAMVGQLAQHLAAQYGPGLGITLEMTKAEMARRVFKFQRQVSGKLGADHASAMRSLATDLETMGLWFADTRSCGLISGSTVEQLLRDFRVRFPNARFAYLDYLQLLAEGEDDPKNNPYQLVTKNITRAKNVAMELDLTLFVLSQLNRDARKQNLEPEMHDLRDSGAIEQAGNIIALLWSDADGRVNVKTAGNRNGPVGTAMLRFNPAKMTLSDWSETAKPQLSNKRRRDVPMMDVAMEEVPIGDF